VNLQGTAFDAGPDLNVGLLLIMTP